MNSVFLGKETIGDRVVQTFLKEFFPQSSTDTETLVEIVKALE
jgi:hypothetical protein